MVSEVFSSEAHPILSIQVQALSEPFYIEGPSGGLLHAA